MNAPQRPQKGRWHEFSDYSVGHEARTTVRRCVWRKLAMATLTVRYDIPVPRFVYGFVYDGEETERAALKEAMRKAAIKAGMNTETWLQSVVIHAPKVLPNAAPDIQLGVNSAVTAWLLDLSAGHPTQHGTIAAILKVAHFLDSQISGEV